MLLSARLEPELQVFLLMIGTGHHRKVNQLAGLTIMLRVEIHGIQAMNIRFAPSAVFN